MSEDVIAKENPQPSKDISLDVLRIIDDPEIKYKSIKLSDYLLELKSEPALSLTMDWKGPDWAKWAKSFVENTNALASGQKRTVTIRCTAEQKNEVPNIFASGVRWVDSEESKS